MKKSLKIISPFGVYGLIVFLLLTLGSFTAAAQGNTISGKVVSSDGLGIPGANVIQKGAKNGVTTNMDGEYAIKLSAGSSVITISYVGFLSQSVDTKNKTKVNVTLKSDSKELDEVVVIGYGTAKKKDVLGSVGTLKADRIVENTPTDPISALQGAIAGVNIISNGGPGEGSEITIRGLSTFNAGASPLFVVDGQQMDNINNVDPTSILSMEVLKDGASAAIYGSKSANGVVLITTKSGKSGKPKVEVNYSSKLAFIASKIPVANTEQRLLGESLRNGGTTITNVDSLSFRRLVVLDLQNMLYQAAFSNQANIAVSGGGEDAKYYWNNSVLDETGVYIGTSFKRVLSSLKLDVNLSKKLKVGTRTNFGYSKGEGNSSPRGLREAVFRRPDIPVYDYDGSYILEESAISNPVAIALEATNREEKFLLNTFNYLEFDLFTPGLKFKTSLAVNFILQKNNTFNPIVVLDPSRSETNGSERNGLRYDWQQENYITYNRTFGKHTVSGLLGMSNQKWYSNTGRYQASAFNNDGIETFNNVKTLDLSRTDTSESMNALSGFFSRLTYDYDGKYLFAATIRRDGSSRVGSDNTWGNFPSVSLGWRLSQEKFLEKVLGSAVSEIKLRASYAVTGNERIGDFDSLLLLTPGSFYNGVNGVATTGELGNSTLGWESTTGKNFGLDLSFFKKRLNFIFDVYDKTTTGLLYDVPVPQETGFYSVKTNIGKVQNRGVEFEVSGTPISSKNFRWDSSFNVAFNENEVLELQDPKGFITGGYNVEVGQSIGNMWGFNNTGVYAYDQSNAYASVNGSFVQLTPVFQNGTFVNYTLNGQDYTGAVSQKRFGSTVLRGGDINWEDLNNDLNIDEQNDRKVIGNGLAKYVGGFYNNLQYKNWTLGFQFNFSLGQDLYREYDWARNRSHSVNGTGAPDRIEGAWRTQGQNTIHATLQNRGWNQLQMNSLYVSDADYIRLRFIRVGYAFSKELIKKLKFVDYINLNMTVNNVVTWTNYTGYNPEFSSGGINLQPGFDQLRYPNKTEFIFGISTRF